MEEQKVSPDWSGVIADAAPVKIVALLLVVTFAAVYESVRLTSLTNSDVWWHLRTGVWMLQNHAFPRTGLFSQYADRDWVDGNWLFQALLALTYKAIGLEALPAMLMAMKVALGVATFFLARGWSGNFWRAIGLCAAAQYAIGEVQLSPAPFSILFFCIELALLIESRRSGDVRCLRWLPLLFLVWADLHGQFLNGLLLLGVFVAVEGVEFLLRSKAPDWVGVSAKPFSKVAGIAAASLLATMLTPYFFRLLPDAFQRAYGTLLFGSFQDMEALPFRRPQHFVLLLLVMGAFLALGRQRSRDWFKIGALVVFIAIAFRVQRDAWIAVLPAVAIIAGALPGAFVRDSKSNVENAASSSPLRVQRIVLAGLVVLVLVATIVRMPGNGTLSNRVNTIFPAAACDFIRDNHLPGPIFNSYTWGGYLTWKLPEYPVAIDGRWTLYGDEINDRYFRVTRGEERGETDPAFSGARTFVLERNAAMTKALTTLPVLRDQFHVVYQDELSTVLVRQ